MHKPTSSCPNLPSRKHIRTIIRLLCVLGLIFLPLIVFVTPAKAILQPTTSPTLSNFHINRNLVTTGDWLIYATYNIPYTPAASVPNVTADETFIFSLMNASGTTELGAVAPYSYSEFNNGYNEGNVFFYSDGTGLTWGTQYLIRLSENPAQFASPTHWDFPIPATAYTSSTSQSANQAEVAANVLSMAKTLEKAFGHTMTEPSAGGTVLYNPYGEKYYRGACPGIQAMAPVLFFVQVIQLDLSSTNWTVTQAQAWEGTFNGTWAGTGQNATAAHLGLTPTTVGGMFIVFPLAVGIMIISSVKFKRIEPGLVVDSVLLILSLLMGWIPAAIFASIYQLMGIYTGYVWFYARAG